jgi:phenylacetate-coenzyme A ligase PaaK-like adenylate-forming protein
MIGRDEITELGLKTLENFKKNPGDDVVFRVTSGTSGKSPIMLLMSADVLVDPQYGTWYTGAQRLVICYGSLVYRHYQALAQTRKKPRGRALAIDLADLNSSLGPLLADFAPDAFLGNPSFIVRAGELCDRATAEAVRDIKCVGELVTEGHRRAFASLFPNARVAGVYTTSELGPISTVTCAYQKPHVFHPRKGITIEIAEPDETGAGDMLLSGEMHGGIQVHQYRIGDVVRELGACACGEEKTFESLGRRGLDFIKLMGTLLVQTEFDRVMREFPMIADYRAEASAVEQGGRLMGKILIRACAHVLPSAALQREIAEKVMHELFLTPDKTLFDLVARKEFLPLSIEWQTDPFPATGKVVKLRHV